MATGSDFISLALAYKIQEAKEQHIQGRLRRLSRDERCDPLCVRVNMKSFVSLRTWNTAAVEWWTSVDVIWTIDAGATMETGDVEAAILLFTVRSEISGAALAAVRWLSFRDT